MRSPPPRAVAQGRVRERALPRGVWCSPRSSPDRLPLRPARAGSRQRARGPRRRRIGSAPTNSDATSWPASSTARGPRSRPQPAPSRIAGADRRADRPRRRVLRRLARRGADARRRRAAGAAGHPVRHGDDRGARPQPGGGPVAVGRHRHSELRPRHPRAGAVAAQARFRHRGRGASAARRPTTCSAPCCPMRWSPILVQVVVLSSVAILLEAALAFLGVGIPPPTPSWGEMLRTGKSFLYEAPYLRRAARPRADPDDPVLRHHRPRAHRGCSKTATRSRDLKRRRGQA